MNGHFADRCPFDHLSIVVLERMPNIHEKYQPLEAPSILQIPFELLVPLFLYFEWDFGEAVTR